MREEKKAALSQKISQNLFLRRILCHCKTLGILWRKIWEKAVDDRGQKGWTRAQIFAILFVKNRVIKKLFCYPIFSLKVWQRFWERFHRIFGKIVGDFITAMMTKDFVKLVLIL
jgi:hypothetical protein